MGQQFEEKNNHKQTQINHSNTNESMMMMRRQATRSVHRILTTSGTHHHHHISHPSPLLLLQSSPYNNHFNTYHHHYHHIQQQYKNINITTTTTTTTHNRNYATNMAHTAAKAVGMLGSVTQKVKNVMDSLSRKKILTVNDVNAAMSNVRLALIQSDVSQLVVDDFIHKLKSEIIGQRMAENVEAPKAATVYALVQRHLTDLLGRETVPLKVFNNNTHSDGGGGTISPTRGEKGRVSFILVTGTQGSGKTTTCAKLAQYARTQYKVMMNHNSNQSVSSQSQSQSQSQSSESPTTSTTTVVTSPTVSITQRELKPFLVSLDTHRPAAMQQLERLAQQIQVPSLPIDPSFLTMGDNSNEKLSATQIVQQMWHFLTSDLLMSDERNDWLVIIDTAGRMQVDAPMMNEIESVHSQLMQLMNESAGDNAGAGDGSVWNKYDVDMDLETLLVADAMLGNEAVNIAKQFHDRLGLSGIVLTRLDGDARGGAAISMKARTGVPIKLIGTGEALNAIDIFDPKGLSDRIMGQGDIGAMARKVMTAASGDERFNPEAIKATMGKISSTGYDFAEYLKMTQMFKQVGGVASMASYLPGEMGQKVQQYSGALERIAGEEVFATHGAIISHMNRDELTNPQMVKSSSARRIQLARAAGVDVIEVNKMLKMFDKFKVFYEKLAKSGMDMNKLDGAKGFADLQNMLMNDPEMMAMMKPKTKVTRVQMRR